MKRSLVGYNVVVPFLSMEAASDAKQRIEDLGYLTNLVPVYEDEEESDET